MKSEKWTKEDIEILSTIYQNYGPKKCSSLLGRTHRACQLKAKKLNIKYIRKFYYEKEFLQKIISESTSYASCIEKIGISARPRNYETIKGYVNDYSIDVSHFFKNKIDGIKKSTEDRKWSIDDILVQNSKYAKSHLKARLYQEGLKSRECEICGQGEEWIGRKMSLILDHKNGINNDNRIENLQIVCPNCNATLDTHCRGPKVIYTE